MLASCTFTKNYTLKSRFLKIYVMKNNFIQQLSVYSTVMKEKMCYSFKKLSFLNDTSEKSSLLQTH